VWEESLDQINASARPQPEDEGFEAIIVGMQPGRRRDNDSPDALDRNVCVPLIVSIKRIVDPRQS